MTGDLATFESALRQKLPAKSFGAHDPKYFEEPRGLFHGTPTLVLKPENTAEVAVILSLANQEGIGVVPYGGGTGLVGGQVADRKHAYVVVSLERMNRILDVDPTGNVIFAEAGVLLQDIQHRAANADRLFPLSLASEGSCRIGGNLATNAGGINVLRYGNARDLCLGLEVVLADGQIWNGLSRLLKDNTGFDLRNLMIGSEGTLGVITAASLRLFPLPKNRSAAFVALDDPKAALDLLALAQDSLGENLSAFELMNETGAAFLMEKMPQVRQILDPTPSWSVLLEISGGESFLANNALERLLEKAFESGIIIDGLLSQSESQRQSFWAFRESIPAANRLVGAIYSHDISVPLKSIPEFVTRANAALAAFGPLRINCFGHLGDGNLHYNVFPPSGRSKDDFAEQRERIRETVYGMVHELGGSISAEHGIGRLKKDDLARYGDPVKLAMMRHVKTALDPKGIMNPGVLF